MRLALYQPDIAQNTGSILRLCACLGISADIVEPAGFAWSESRFRRAGMDYVDNVDLTRHQDYSAFDSARRRAGARLVLLTTAGATPYFDYDFSADDWLMLGRESAGVPETVHADADARLVIPMAPGMRSLNVAVSAGIVLAEALRQTNSFPSLAR
ncbi:MAG: tRNA (cytidine(34)-2'-O)-methyltransferase [Flavobacteriaceae bacterium]